MSIFARVGHNSIMKLVNQELTTIPTAIVSLLPQCHQLALVTVALHFRPSTLQQACQESAEALCQAQRRSVRGSDLVYLYGNGTEHYSLFFILPQADMNGGDVVQKRLQAVLASTLSQIASGSVHIEIQRYVLYMKPSQTSLMIEGSTSTDVRIDQRTVCVHYLLTRSRAFKLQREEPLPTWPSLPPRSP